MKPEELDHSPMAPDEVLERMSALGLDRKGLAAALNCSVVKVRKMIGKGGEPAGAKGLDAAVLRLLEPTALTVWRVSHVETGMDLGQWRGSTPEDAVKAYMEANGIAADLDMSRWVVEAVE